MFCSSALSLEGGVDVAQKISSRPGFTGPGSVNILTDGDILMSFGAMVRIIPTSEADWDFGMSDNVSGFLLPLAPSKGDLRKSFFKNHGNSCGWVNSSYIRSENRLFFNAMPGDKKWSFYAALEFDKALDTAAVDSRGGKSKRDSDFGLERLHITYALPWNLRFPAGWGIWHIDARQYAGLVYGDDNPGFWLTGKYDSMDFNIGWFKLQENDFQSDVSLLSGDADDDRDVYAGYLNWEINKTSKLRLFYAFDRIRSIPATDMLGKFSGGAFGITGSIPDTDSHHMGFCYIGHFGDFELFAEGVYQFGKSENTGLRAWGNANGKTLEENYDISAYALAGDVSFNLINITGYNITPHLGFIYTSGDDDPTDGNLNGYNGIANLQRKSRRWGGENTIIGDTNFVLGTILYSYIPEMYGNGTPVFTGGLQNSAGMGTGRGDNPGLSMISPGVTFAPWPFIIYRTNANMFFWNEDFQITNMVDPVLGSTLIEAGYVGTEWDNEITIGLSKQFVIKLQAAFFFPGDGVEDATRALSGKKSDDIASRLGVELILNF